MVLSLEEDPADPLEVGGGPHEAILVGTYGTLKDAMVYGFGVSVILGVGEGGRDGRWRLQLT